MSIWPRNFKSFSAFVLSIFESSADAGLIFLKNFEKGVDFFVRMIYIYYTDKKGGDKVPPRKGRPPIECPKNVRFEIRMTQKQAEILEDCAKKLHTNRTAIINKGIEMVKAELEKE